jgi:peptide/nickel transport system substrate-binding protein
MRSIGSRSFAAISVFIAALCFLMTLSSRAAKRPVYGGTLRVEMQAAKVSLDPREWKAGTQEFSAGEKLAALVFDRLVGLDNYGRFQPQLATEWSHDAAFRRWQFTLRAGVKFTDGSPLTASDVVATLQPLLPNGQAISASGNTVVIQAHEPVPDLLEQLASGRFFVYRTSGDGTLLGTGPFFLFQDASEKRPLLKPANPASKSANAPNSFTEEGATHLRFRANDENWAGRPFLDGVDVTLGVPALRQLFDLELGKADLVEVAPDLVRRATQEKLRVWSSEPVLFYGLRFEDTQAGAADASLREALSLSLDRQTIAGVLLQKQAEPASSLLPQWLSGYAFLFHMDANLEHAKEIRATLPASLTSGADPLRLRVDVPGDVPKLLGERVAINARQAGISLQVVNRPALTAGRNGESNPAAEPAASIHLFSWHVSSLSPRNELDAFTTALNLPESASGKASSSDPEELYGREQKLLEDRHIIPLVAMPESVALAANVHDWMPGRWGEWYLADVWLEQPAAAGAPSSPQAVPEAKP